VSLGKKVLPAGIKNKLRFLMQPAVEGLSFFCELVFTKR